MMMFMPSWQNRKLHFFPSFVTFQIWLFHLRDANPLCMLKQYDKFLTRRGQGCSRGTARSPKGEGWAEHSLTSHQTLLKRSRGADLKGLQLCPAASVSIFLSLWIADAADFAFNRSIDNQILGYGSRIAISNEWIDLIYATHGFW